MKRLRLRIVLLACWVFLFNAIDRYSDAISISDTVYLAVVSIMLIVLLASRIAKIPLWIILTVPLAFFALLKAWSGEFAKGFDLTAFTLEIIAMAGTTFLAYWVSMAVVEFETAVLKVAVGRPHKLPESEVEGNGFLYREVRRARNHQRPLAVMAVGVSEKSLKYAVDRMVQDVQMAIIKQFTLAGLSKALCEELEDCAVIVQREDHFLVALPETKAEEVPVIIDRLRKQVLERVGVELEVGTAMLPGDSFTFEGLVDKATAEMHADLKTPFVVDFDRIPAENPVTEAK